MDFSREPTLRDLENCPVPAEHKDLQELIREVRWRGAVVTVQEFPPRKRRAECSGFCGTCPHADDCDILYQRILGDEGFIRGAIIA